MQFRFKVVPKHPIWLGVETNQKVELSTAWHWSMTAVLGIGNALSRARGVDMKYSFGQKRCDLETEEETEEREKSGNGYASRGKTGDPREEVVERGALLWNIHAVDYLKQHKKGEELPDMAKGKFPDMTLADKQECVFDNTEDWYTCVYYSMYVDLARWSCENLPGGPMDMKNFVEQKNGLTICVYDLPDVEDGGTDSLHDVSVRRDYMSLTFQDPRHHEADEDEDEAPDINEDDIDDFKSVGSDNAAQET